MRALYMTVIGLSCLAASVAEAKIAITVDKDVQQMTVAVDGVEKYRWPVSSGNPSHETPGGSFQTFRYAVHNVRRQFSQFVSKF